MSFDYQKCVQSPFVYFRSLFAPVCQTETGSHYLLFLLSNLYRDITEVHRLWGVIGDCQLRALCTTVYEDTNKLNVFITILLKFEQTVLVAKDIL